MTPKTNNEWREKLLDLIKYAGWNIGNKIDISALNGFIENLLSSERQRLKTEFQHGFGKRDGFNFALSEVKKVVDEVPSSEQKRIKKEFLGGKRCLFCGELKTTLEKIKRSENLLDFPLKIDYN